MRYIEGLNTKKEMTAMLAELQQTEAKRLPSQNLSTRGSIKLEMRLMKLLATMLIQTDWLKKAPSSPTSLTYRKSFCASNRIVIGLAQTFNAKGAVGVKLILFSKNSIERSTRLALKPPKVPSQRRLFSMKSLLEKLREQANIE